MERLRLVLLVALLGLCVCLASASDSLRTADSLRDVQSPLSLWPDSGLVRGDSLGYGQGAAHRWLLPLGVIILTGASAWLLFSARSK
jgi:hypothetical protein